jgi:aspartyl/asparaginyl-tRNA synthetase
MNKHQIYDRVLKTLWRWADEHHFEFHPTPRIVTATGACENVDTLWSVDSPDIPGQYFFAQTGQLYLEMALARTARAFTVGSSGRAEAIVDHRHLREFTFATMGRQTNLDQSAADHLRRGARDSRVGHRLLG